MTNEELRQALTQRRREQVDVNIGQVSLRPTAQPGGQYGVQVRATPKENSYTELSKALNQFPQLAGQYANIQRAAGQRQIEALSPEELEDRAFNGDHTARETIFNRFKSEGINEALFKARYETVIFPGLAAKEQEFKDLNPEQVEAVFHDANGNPLKSEDIIENLRVQFSSVIPEDVRTNPNQKVMYNRLLRQLNGVATKSYAMLENKRQKFLDDSIVSGISKSANTFRMRFPLHASEDNLEIPNNAGVNVVTSGNTILPAIAEDDTQPQVVRNKISVYSPQKGGKLKKMEGGYESKFPGADGKSIVRTLEDFRKDPENTVVTLAGNPEFNGRRYVVESMTYQTAAGKQYTLSNVPVMVHDTGELFKTAPEGMFDIPVERDTGNELMRTNDGLLKDIQFIRDKGSESGKPVKVKRTAAEATKQRSADVEFKQNAATDEIFDAMMRSYNGAVSSIPPGSSLTPAKIRNRVEAAFESKLTDMVLNGQHVQVQDFIDRASGTGPNGEVTKPTLFAGQPISPSILSSLRRAVRAEESRLERDDPKLTESEEKALKAARQNLGAIARNSPNVSMEETLQAFAKASLDFEQLVLKNNFSKATEVEFYKEVDRAKDKLETLGAAKNWDGLYQTQDFVDKIDAKNDPGSRFREELKSAQEFLRIAEINGIDLSALQISNEDYALLGPVRQPQWRSITNGITTSAMAEALSKAKEEMALLYQDAGERDPGVNIDVQDQDEDGNPRVDENGNPIMTRSRSLYLKMLRRHYTDSATKLISDTKEQQKLIDAANRLKRGKVKAPEDEVDREVKAIELEEKERREDFLDKEGKSTRSYGDMDGDFLGDDGEFLDRWVRTAENPDALALMDAQTPREKLDSDIQNVVLRITPKYLKSAVRGMASTNNAVTKRKRRTKLETQLKYTGLPMSLHTDANAMLIEVGSGPLFDPEKFGSSPYAEGPQIKRTVLDLNRGDRYSDPATAKTHVYNYYAIRDTRFPASDDYDPYEKLNILYDIYFKGQEATYPRKTFFADQEALGKQIKLNPSK